MSKQASTLTWIRLAWITGLASTFCYLGAAVLPLPISVAMPMAFAFGPLLSISHIGSYRYFSTYRNGPLLQSATLMGVIAGIMVLTMLILQMGNGMFRAEALALADTEAARQAAESTWLAVNQVQLLMDVVWDVFIGTAMVLTGFVLSTHPKFGKVWGGLGVLMGLAVLILNMMSFPIPPAEAGSFDIGPVVGLYSSAMLIRLAFLKE